MKILNKEIDFSFTDANNLEKLEKAVAVAQEKIKKINPNDMMSKAVKEAYIIVSECFDTIFGDGFSEQIFENKVDFMLCIKAFKDLVNAKNEQDMQLDTEIESLKNDIENANNKYSSNRTIRRSK